MASLLALVLGGSCGGERRELVLAVAADVLCQSSFPGFGQCDVTPWLEVSRACSNRVDAPAVLPLPPSAACCPTGRNCYKHPKHRVRPLDHRLTQSQELLLLPFLVGDR